VNPVQVIANLVHRYNVTNARGDWVREVEVSTDCHRRSDCPRRLNAFSR
jgi:hypothetical protein